MSAESASPADPDSRLLRLAQFAEQSPGNLPLLAELADGLLRAGLPAQARPWALQAVQWHQQDAPARYRLAVIEHANGDAAAARALLEALVQEGIQDPAVLHELARAQGALGDWEAVRQTLEPITLAGLPAALRHRVLLLRLRALHHAGQVQEAIALGEQAAADHDDEPALDVAAAMATLYLDAERVDDAARLLDLHQSAAPSHAELQAVGAYVSLHRADPAAALDWAQRSLQLRPGFGRAHLAAGLAHATRGELPAAEAALVAATSSMPSHLGSWHALAWMQLLQNNVDGAERSFLQALEHDRNFGDTHGGLAIAAALRGDRTSAEHWARSGGKLDRRSMNVAVARALLVRGGGLGDPGVLADALGQFDERVLAGAGGSRPLFEALLARARAGRSRGT